MKNIIYTILIITLFCCDSSTEKKVSESSGLSESSQVLTTKRISWEDDRKTIFDLVKFNDFNKAGYALLMPVNDKYGYEKWEAKTPTYIYEQSTVTELKKYNLSSDFYYSDLGRFVLEQMWECNKLSAEKIRKFEAVCYIKGL